MQSMLQLNPPIPMRTPKGEGMATLVIDYGPDFDLWWTVIVSKGEHAGEVWTYPNHQVRGVDNVTLGRLGVATPAGPRPLNGCGAKGSGPNGVPRDDTKVHLVPGTDEPSEPLTPPAALRRVLSDSIL